MANRLKVWHHLFFFFMITLLICGGFMEKNVAHGQTGTLLAVSPDVTNLYFNGELSTQVQITITDVVLLNGFDITLTYDPNLIVLDSWSKTDFLKSLWCPAQSDTPGNFRLGCAQLGMPGVSGSGPLINLTFSGVLTGVTQITINEDDLELSDSSSQAITVTIQNGTINVGYATSAVAGNIFLQGQSVGDVIPASLGTGATYAQGPFNAASSDVLGLNLLFPAVVNSDSYIFTTRQPGYLNIDASLGKTVILTDSDLTLPPLRLLAGDATADNVIDAADASLVGASYGLTLSDLAAGKTLDADVNFDGVVNLRDLALVAGNFDLTSALAYESWVP